MSQPIPVRGLFESHLSVADLDRSLAFYRDIVGLEPALEVPERGAAFLWIGPGKESMLGLWTLGSAPLGMTQHIAFAADLDDVLAAPARLEAAGVTPLSFFLQPATEPSVIAWMPAASVYFLDPDGNQLEYLAMLDQEPDPSGGIVDWSDWRP
jgi:lactoylglutathione lyase